MHEIELPAMFVKLPPMIIRPSASGMAVVIVAVPGIPASKDGSTDPARPLVAVSGSAVVPGNTASELRRKRSHPK
jgi:hypothetical protein